MRDVVAWIASISLLVACGGGGSSHDAGVTDAPQAIADGAATDAPQADAAIVADGAPADAPQGDAALADAALADAALADAALADAALPDAGPPAIDAAPPDAAPADAAPPPPLIEGLATLAGNETPALVDGFRADARFVNPVNVVSDADGNVLVADFDNSVIRKATPVGDVSTLTAPQASFIRPFGMARDGTTLYVQTDRSSTNLGTGALWRIDLTTGGLTLLADGIGRNRGLAVLSDGRLVMAEYQRHVIRIFDPTTGQVSALAGALDQPGFVDATGADARFTTPYDLVVEPGDVILVADFGNDRIRQVTLAGAVTTFAGTGSPGADNGARLGATFNQPQGLARDAAGNLYVSEPGNNLVRRIDASGQVTTVAGDGVAGWRDAADPLTGELYGLEGLDAAPGGAYLYIADGDRGDGARFHRVRRLSLPP